MAILLTNTTVTPFVPHTGTPLTPQEEPISIELLSEAINSLQNDVLAQTNEFVKRLQQVSPDTAKRIFQLTWERSGKPMHLGDCFGEEAFFGYWGRSIDPTIKLEILGQVLEETAAMNAQAPSTPESHTALMSQDNPFHITEIALAIFSYCDLRTLQSLARVDRFINACVQAHVEQLDLKDLCPSLRILNAEAQGLTIPDEPPVSKLWILRNYTELKHHVENGEGLTLLTMPKGRTLNQLIAIAAQAGIARISANRFWDLTVKQLGNVPVEQTYVILITNSVFQQSRNKSYAEQQELVAGHRCMMPTLQEYVALCVFTNKVFQKCLYGKNPRTFGRTSTRFKAFPLAVGSSTPARLCVYHYYYDCEYNGAGGQRKLCDTQA